MSWIKDKLQEFSLWLGRQQSIPDLSAVVKLKESYRINTFDCDGVVYINAEIGGVHPGPHDVIITGRSYDERPETEAMLIKRGIYNKVYYNKSPFEKKTRVGSGLHKAATIMSLEQAGYTVKCHFEDDPVQADVIQANLPNLKIVRLVHNFTNLENVRHREPT